MILEDLHWSDESSLEFLHFFARRLADQPLLLVLTYRSTEVTSGLQQLLAQLDRWRLATELTLTRLHSTETEAMIQAIFAQQQAVQTVFVAKIYNLTEGNPFFVEETLKALVAAGEIYLADGRWTRKAIEHLHIPRTVQVAVARRTAHLSSDARHLLTLAAVAGRRFDFALLQAITGHGEAHLIELIKELLRAQLVMEESAERFAFRHALTQQAIYSDLLLRERRLLHRSVAETLERLYPDPRETHSTDLAYHYSQDVTLARGAIPSAHGQRQVWCSRAEWLLAKREPSAALTILDQLIAADPHTATLGEQAIPRLAGLRGEALTQLGRYADAERTLIAAQPFAQAALPLLWRLHLTLGNCYRRQNRRDDADQANTAAWAILTQLAGKISDANV